MLGSAEKFAVRITARNTWKFSEVVRVPHRGHGRFFQGSALPDWLKLTSFPQPPGRMERPGSPAIGKKADRLLRYSFGENCSLAILMAVTAFGQPE